MMKKLLVVILCFTGMAFGLSSQYLRPQVNTVGLVAHYKLWDGLMTTGKVFDYSLNGNTGIVSNALPVYPGFSFDAVDDEIACGSGSTIDDIFVGGGTVSMWLLSDGRGESNQGRAIGKAQWRTAMDSNTTTMRFQQNFDVGPNGVWQYSIPSGVWFHLAIAYSNDLGANSPIVYINGASASVSEITPPSSDVNSSDAAEVLYIGDSSGSDRSWDGKVGGTMLFDKLLSADTIKSIYETTRWRYAK